MFLFQIGAIKSLRYFRSVSFQEMFLFQIGAIKSEPWSDDDYEALESFYSKLVRLKVGRWL